MRKVLVTGATGHVGNVLIKELKKQGFEVYGLVMPFDRIDYIKDNCKILYGNVLDLEGLKYLFQDMNFIIHTAGLIDIGSGNKKQLFNVNINGTLNVMKAALYNNVKRVIYTSSVHAIPTLKKNKEMKEIEFYDPKKVSGNYAKSKAIATQRALDFARTYNLDLVIAVLGGVIGADDYKGSYMGEVIKSYLNGKLPVYIKGGYNYVDVKDVAQGIILALEKGISYESYLLSGYYITIKEYLDIVAKYTNKKPLKRAINYYFILLMSKFAELYYIVNRKKMLLTTYSVKVLRSNANFSNQKAKETLGWRLRPIKDTIHDLVDFIQLKNK